MVFRRIVFTGDLLRPELDGTASSQFFNIRWCADLLGAQIAAATGLEPQIVAWRRDGALTGGLDSTAIAAIYGQFGLPCTVRGWARIYAEDVLPLGVEAYLLEQFRDALVVGFELPPYLEAVLRRHSVAFVDLAVHPVRFLDDIFLGVRTSDPDANARLARYAIDAETIATMAGVQKAAMRRNVMEPIAPGSALLVLQTRFDRTLVRDGGFVDIMDHLAEIQAVAAGCPTLLIKEHPFDLATPQASALRRAIPNSEATETNIYRLLASDEIDRVLTLSSSVGVEAGAFGKPVRFLHREPGRFLCRGDTPQSDAYVGIFDDLLSTDFWRDVLAPMTPTGPARGVRIPFKANRLRMSLDSFWGFAERS